MPSRSLVYRRFEASVGQVDELLAIYRYIHANSEIPAKDNILRAALTMLVSAIDTSVHEFVISAVARRLSDDRLVFDITKQLVSIQCILESDPSQRTAMAEADIRRQYAKETFQSSRQIETILASIGMNKIWSRLSGRLGNTPEEIKLKLDLMVRRRNQIVHEADLDGFHCLQPISLEMVESLYEFTTQLVRALFAEYENPG
ncbi:MAG: HEPN domain-containing protein [Sulfuritalea sp.]|nr:HEPN domain-containing protein [Sulfuritalea sp.]